MKAISIREAQGQLGELIAQTCRGEIIVLTYGDRRVTLEPGVALDLEEDSPELEVELLKAVNGPHSPYSSEEMRLRVTKFFKSTAAKSGQRVLVAAEKFQGISSQTLIARRIVSICDSFNAPSRRTSTEPGM